MWIECESPKVYTGLIYGEHAFAVRAIDALGHADLEPAEYEWDVAIAAPPVEITSKPALRTDETSATFVFSADAMNPPYECSLDAGEWSPCTSPKTYNGLLLAPHTFEVRVLVPEEQEEPPTTLYAWTVTELDPPETTIVFGPDPLVPSVSTTATFAIQSDEPPSTFECTSTTPASRRARIRPSSPASRTGRTRWQRGRPTRRATWTRRPRSGRGRWRPTGRRR